MNHLESSFTGKNHIWRYIVMAAAVLIASNTIGAIPLIVAFGIKAASDPEVFSAIAENPNDLSILGLDPNLGLFMMLFPFLAGLFAFMLLVKPLNNRSFLFTINGTTSLRWKRILVSGLIWLILSALYFFVYLKADPGNFVQNNTSGTLILLILVSVVFIPFQAAFEEVLFRGYFMQGFAVLSGNRWFPLLMTSLLFGLMHSFNPEVKEFGFLSMMPQYLLFGLIFGIITILDDGIEAAVGAHAANNIFLCIMVTHDSSALQTAAIYEQQNIYPSIEAGALLITGILFVLILKAVFGWKSYMPLFSRINATKTDQIPYTDVLSSTR